MKGIFKSRCLAFSSRPSGRLRPVVMIFRYLEMGRNIIISTDRKETYISNKPGSGATIISKYNLIPIEIPVSRDRYASLSAKNCSGVDRFNMPTMTIPMVTERAPMT